ncbi:hypothetical protein BKA61DRAFT_567908 [Leptodontidium sp. MPI-SDFR-AT-0119]|nr:hypothetical protein BKA61DRAFT_567908 [Leptodontidium sp. MPI-SDFR-AT-0119]
MAEGGSSRGTSETYTEDIQLEKWDKDDPKLKEQRRGLLNPSFIRPIQAKERYFSKHIFALYLLNLLLAATATVMFVKLQTEKLRTTHFRTTSRDPSLGIWFGISKISEEEAKMLLSPTLPIPGTNEYLIQFDVWHELHCLNDLRKIIYPERFPNMSLNNITVNGIVNRENDMFRHWDHCIDALRQTLMCHADISPIPFHVNVPKSSGIFPRLATTHTCRNFTKIQEWSKEHSAGEFKFLLNEDEARETTETAGFDQSPEEDIEFLYGMFPGNKFFRHWREHNVCDVGEICPDEEDAEEDAEDMIEEQK